MLLKARNSTLIENAKKTYLTAASAVSATSLTVKDNTGFITDNQYIMLGEPGQDGTEIVQNNAYTTAGTSITIDNEGSGGCTFAHEIGTPIYAISYNQVEFSHTTTTTGAKTVMATSALTPDHEDTQYQDTTYTSGYYFIRFKNATSTTYSQYSDPIPYTGYTTKSLFNVLKKVRRLLDEPDESQIKDSDIIEEINDKQRDIAHDRIWSFYEGTKSLSTVKDQFKYDVASDVNLLFGVKVDTQPLAVIGKQRWEELHWDSDTASDDVSHSGFWDDALWIYPRPSSDATATAINDADDITASDTTITVDSTSGFNRGDFYRFIIDDEVIYATASTATTFTGCLRGQEGTTAATHADNAVVTERDIVYTYLEEPTDLDSMTDETKIPEPMLLAYGVAMELALKKNDEALHDRLMIKYEKSLNRLRAKYVKKIISGIMIIKDINQAVHDYGNFVNPNDYPKNLQ